ncbi:MAG: hypothetical protein D6715_01605 [Calditrichaeota bacterium]|nr:MAG: hypothetical protein D6715_01605 [Calditrichota bacterium]
MPTWYFKLTTSGSGIFSRFLFSRRSLPDLVIWMDFVSKEGIIPHSDLSTKKGVNAGQEAVGLSCGQRQ